MIQNAIGILKEVYSKYELRDLADELDSGLAQIMSSGLQVAFLGPVKAGKSTIINALIMQDRLPVQEIPTTGCITELRCGDKLKYFVQLDDEPEVLKEIDEVLAEQFILGSHENKVAQKVVIEIPLSGLLEDGDVFIVDTPGIKSTIVAHDLITQEYLPNVDVAFFVMSSQHGGPQAEVLDFIRDDIKNVDLRKLYFLVSKSDLHPLNEQEIILKQFRKQLSTVIDNPRVFLVSGRKALDKPTSKIEEMSGNLGAVYRLIQEEILPEKKRFLTNKCKEFIDTQVEHLESILKGIHENSDLDTSELKEKVKNIRKEMTDIESRERKLTSAFKTIQNNSYLAADSAAMELTNTLVAQYQLEGIVSDEELSAIVSIFQNRLKDFVSTGLKEVDDISFLLSNPDFQQVLGNVTTANEIVSTIDKIATFLVAAAILPGSVPGSVEALEGIGGAGMAVLESFGKKGDPSDSTKPAQKSKFMAGLGKVAQLVNELNLIHKVSESVLKPLVMRKVSKTKFRRELRTYTEEYMDSVQAILSTYIEINVYEPLREKQATCRSIISLREKEGDKFLKYIANLSEDIRRVSSMRNRG